MSECYTKNSLSIFTLILLSFRGITMNNITIMLEDMKVDSYKGYSNYLKQNEVQELRKWYEQVATKPATIEAIINFIYELYIYEDIDFRPYDEYVRIVSNLAEKYHFNNRDFLKLYQQYKVLVGV